MQFSLYPIQSIFHEVRRHITQKSEIVTGKGKKALAELCFSCQVPMGPIQCSYLNLHTLLSLEN